MSDYIIAIILGIIEGLTEFLPISSTGHLILTAHLLEFEGEKSKTFEVVIQLGAILAVVVFYWRRLLKIVTFKETAGLNVVHIIFAMIPAVTFGLIFHDFIKTFLFSPKTVVFGLFFGAFLMIYAEKRRRKVVTSDLDQITYKQAFGIGLFQCLALWPGFSRAGATISGGLILGTNHKTAAEFSFLVAVPMMLAASGLDLFKNYHFLEVNDIGFFAVGFATAFFVALLAIVTFIKVVSRISLTYFAYYRMILAVIFAIYLF